MLKSDDKYGFTGLEKQIGDITVYQIVALKDIPEKEVCKGDIGGWIACEGNLSQKGTCWVGDDAAVYGNASITEHAHVKGHAEICGDAKISGNAKIRGYARIYGNACLTDNVFIDGYAEIYGHAVLVSRAKVTDNAKIFGNARLEGTACAMDTCEISGNAEISSALIRENAVIYGRAYVTDGAVIGKDGFADGLHCGTRYSGHPCYYVMEPIDCYFPYNSKATCYATKDGDIRVETFRDARRESVPFKEFYEGFCSVAKQYPPDRTAAYAWRLKQVEGHLKDVVKEIKQMEPLEDAIETLQKEAVSVSL